MGKFATDPFKDVTKEKAKLTLSITGPSGSGKTWTALEIATRIAEAEGGKVALLETEGRSSSFYARHFEFRAMRLNGDYNPNRYVDAIQAAADFGYSVLVIDSFSHAWNSLGGVLETVDKQAAKMSNNKWAGWATGRPLQNTLANAVVNTPINLIGTMRARTLWEQRENPKTQKKEPVKIGLQSVQSHDLEYEFTVAVLIDMAHRMTLSKSRFSDYPAGMVIENCDKFVDDLIKWLGDGTEPEPRTEPLARVEVPLTNGTPPPPVEIIDPSTGEVETPAGEPPYVLRWADEKKFPYIKNTILRQIGGWSGIVDELVKGKNITDINDPIQWDKAFATGKEAATFTVEAFNTKPKLPPTAAPETPMYGNTPVPQPKRFEWKPDDIQQMDAFVLHNYWDAELSGAMLPDKLLAMSEIIGAAWSGYANVDAAKAHISATAQALKIPIIARKAIYRGQYTEFWNGQFSVRVYGARDILKALDSAFAVVETWQEGQEYELPLSVVVGWQEKAYGNGQGSYFVAQKDDIFLNDLPF